MSDELDDLMWRLKGGDKEPHFHNVKFVISPIISPIFIESDCKMFEDWCWMGDNFDEETLPKEFGVYSARVSLRSFRSNNFDDPEEWDMEIHLLDVVKLMELTEHAFNGS